jgi:hypothetical protein
MKQMVDTFNNRMKDMQEESNRQEVTILGFSDKTRKLQASTEQITSLLWLFTDNESCQCFFVASSDRETASHFEGATL